MSEDNSVQDTTVETASEDTAEAPKAKRKYTKRNEVRVNSNVTAEKAHETISLHTNVLDSAISSLTNVLVTLDAIKRGGDVTVTARNQVSDLIGQYKEINPLQTIIQIEHIMTARLVSQVSRKT